MPTFVALLKVEKFMLKKCFSKFKLPEILPFLALEQKNYLKCEYPSNQQESIYRISVIFFKSRADSSSTFLVRHLVCRRNYSKKLLHSKIKKVRILVWLSKSVVLFYLFFLNLAELQL